MKGGFDEAHFWSKVNKTDNCWVWTGYTNRNGYGEYASPHLTTRLVHRISYALINGGVPDMPLDHLCRNKACCNPGHLEPVDNLTNVRRSSIGRHHGDKTHCPQGHEYTEENTEVWNGTRACRTCKRQRKRDARARKKEREQ